MQDSINNVGLESMHQDDEPSEPLSPYDTLTKDQLQGISRYNESIIREQFANGTDVGKSVYLQQVLAEQQAIEARLAMLEQRPDEREEYLKSLPPLPEYVLSVKNRAAQRPLVLRGRGQVMSIEDAARIERQYADSQKRPVRQRPQDTSSLSEQEKHRLILEYMNHRDSDEDEDDTDEDEYWADDGEPADEAGAVGGEWIDTNDLSHLITVDRERIAAGGFYTNFVDDP